MKKAMTLTYETGGNLYLNVTNRCPCACVFCIRKNDDGTEEVVHEWTSKNSAEEFQVEKGTYVIHEKEAPEGFIVAEDVEVVIDRSAREHEEPVVYKFTMVDRRDTDVPTGVEELRTPIVRTILVLVIAAGALTAAYFGIVHRRKKDKD